MPHVLVRHKVKDYATWKGVYDEHGAMRRAAGCQGSVVFRNAANPNEVVVLLEWDKLEKAQQFTQSDELRATMEQAGVADMPDVYFLNEADRTSQ
jgi:heme-degrading monooxygenase HmoA